ncbi:hypothetical protein DSCA_11540 [Desulfosarcina alkanivorans]|uniref:Vitamin K epoxide reductase domain-containing protein n=2 Tax=Desulfosarcina alkanivorans TaxID=571177 RepID=A0A5K7YLM7_9BACT|nr:vitamin K epoxide reductase family protein [Desulfosarcina alkanivorans]BBO67224.1 hypothetical protein DSCA_11540 [Desulfosarcina alkanivorans]
MDSNKKNKTIRRLPYPWYYFTVAVIALTGLMDSVYLSVSHYRVYTDIGYESFCAISRAINCDTVSQSPYAVMFNVPVPVWGVLGYAFFIVLLVFAWPEKAENKRPWTLLFLISLAFSAYSMVLAGISAFMIHSYCIMCILSYAVNLLLLYFVWLIRKRYQCEPVLKAVALDTRYLMAQPAALPLFFTSVVAGTLMVLFFPAYWHMNPPDLSGKIPTGITEDGHPWIGAEDPEMVIVEFSDYRCFQCRKMHFYLRRIIEKNSGKIRLVHRHFPMDHAINPLVGQPFHTGSANLSIIALFAAEKGKFWEMNDLIFNLPRNTKEVKIKDLAEQADIDLEAFRNVFGNELLWKKLIKDVEDGMKHKLTGTPGFVIDGRVYIGQIPAELLRKYF